MAVVFFLLLAVIDLVPTLATTPSNLTTKLHTIPQTLSSQLEVSSIIFSLSKLASQEHLSEDCFMDLKAIERGTIAMEPWAMKVLESSGAKDSGFIWGQNYWLGSPEGCSTVQGPLQITLSSRYKRNMMDGLITQTAPFKMDYRVAHVKHNSPWQIEIKFMTERVIHIGLCLPSSCSSAEIKNLTQTYLDENALMRTYDLQSEVLYVKDLKLKEIFFEKITLKMLSGVVIFTLVMMIAARFIPDDSNSAVATFIKCFDIVSNGQALFTVVDNTPNSIPVINGIRSVACFWIITTHVGWFTHFTMNNKAFFAHYFETFSFHYITPGFVLVDAFFTISGFLQTYNFMRNEQQLQAIRKNTLGGNVKTFGRILFHRYLRLAPLYLVTLVSVELFTSYAQDTSLFHLNEHYDQLCADHWWRNIIFIQSFFDDTQMCLSWSWSLACEMQFFCLILVLLFVYTKHPQVVKKIVLGGVLAAIASTYLFGFKSHYQNSIDVGHNTKTEMYTNPFVRILPYLLGTITGWWLVQKKGQFTVGAFAEKCVWNLAIIVSSMCIFSTIKTNMTTLQTVSMFLFGRSTFSMSICWAIICSATGRSSWWSRILEHKLCQHLNRVSYAVYLLNPVVITFVFSLSKTSSHTDPLMHLVLCYGFMVMVYLVSVVFSLAFEVPYCNWSSALKKTARKPKAT